MIYLLYYLKKVREMVYRVIQIFNISVAYQRHVDYLLLQTAFPQFETETKNV